WLFYTVVKSYFHNNSIPWYDIMLSGFGLDEEGRTMHKSKGNIILPLDVVKKYSADAVRWWASSVKLGDDLPYSEKDVITGHRLCIKLWNASKLISSHIDEKIESCELREVDKWILSKIDHVIEKTTAYLDRYEYSKARTLIETSFWHDFCDNYLEIVKYRVYEKKDKAAKYTLYNALLAYLKLFAIYIPHITEEIYQSIFKKFEGYESIHISPWPEKMGIEKSDLGEICVEIISSLRKWKSDKGMPLNAKLEHITIFSLKNLKSIEEDIKNPMNVERIEFKEGKPEIEEKIIKVVPNYRVIGPSFGEKTKEIIKLLQNPEIAKRIDSGETVTEYKLCRDHISRIEKEYMAEGKKVDIITGKDYIIEIF
ncbi:MAG TPA: hypothetical protein ENG20_04955, partial [Methanomicrobia archaeon]|nr:hypothetical protein [Methanomicrobia archaeon]